MHATATCRRVSTRWRCDTVAASTPSLRFVVARRPLMAHDLLIKNGMLVDGTGAPARRADLAIAGGKITEVGRVTDGATTVIDASDLVVAPGFIDPHTHYDAQICRSEEHTSELQSLRHLVCRHLLE